MVLFINATVDIYEEIQDAEICGTDEYNNPVKCPNLVDTVDGHFEHKTSADSIQRFGPADQTVFILNLPVDVDINRLDRVNVATKDGTNYGCLSVKGKPGLFNSFNSITGHVKVTLIKER